MSAPLACARATNLQAPDEGPEIFEGETMMPELDMPLRQRCGRNGLRGSYTWLLGNIVRIFAYCGLVVEIQTHLTAKV